jgi:hypothetical protein
MQCDSDGPVNTFANTGSHSLFTDGLDYSRGAGGRDRRVRRDSAGVGGAIACAGIAGVTHEAWRNSKKRKFPPFNIMGLLMP